MSGADRLRLSRDCTGASMCVMCKNKHLLDEAKRRKYRCAWPKLKKGEDMRIFGFYDKEPDVIFRQRFKGLQS